MEKKTALLKGIVGGETVELMVQTDAASVVVDENTTLAEKLDGMDQSLNEKASKEDIANKADKDALKALEDQVSQSAGVQRLTFPASLSIAWTGTGPYSQEVALEGVQKTDTPHIAPQFGTAPETARLQAAAWNCVTTAVALDGSIRFYCLDKKPETAIPIQIEVLR